MGRSGTTTKRARSATSGASTPESTLAETVTPADEKSSQSSPSDEDGQDDARRAGEQVLSLLTPQTRIKTASIESAGYWADRYQADFQQE